MWQTARARERSAAAEPINMAEDQHAVVAIRLVGGPADGFVLGVPVNAVPEFFGVGTLEFDPAHPDRAQGWFSSSPRLALEQTNLVSRVCRKAPMDGQALVADDPEVRKQAVERLLRWRESL